MYTVLNDDQVEILSEVRDILRAQFTETEIPKYYSGGFICVQILRILGNREGIEQISSPILLSDEGKAMFHELTDAISYAIRVPTQFGKFKSTSSVGIYLNSLDLNISLSRMFDDIAPLARLAWLDRMIETRVIA